MDFKDYKITSVSDEEQQANTNADYSQPSCAQKFEKRVSESENRLDLEKR